MQLAEVSSPCRNTSSFSKVTVFILCPCRTGVALGLFKALSLSIFFISASFKLYRNEVDAVLARTTKVTQTSATQ